LLLDNGKLQLAAEKVHLFPCPSGSSVTCATRTTPEVASRDLEVLPLASRGRTSTLIARECETVVSRDVV
jgi:hypothetical protein